MKLKTRILLTLLLGSALLGSFLLGRMSARSQGGSTEAVSQRITAKVERIKAAVQQMMAAGTDPSAIAKTMQEKVAPLLDSGKIAEAEPELDRILAQLTSGEKPTTGTQPPSPQFVEETRKRLTEKVERVKAGAQKWMESGRDPSAIGQAMEQKFKPLMEAGKIAETEAELDRVLAQLFLETSSGESPAASTASPQQRIMAKVERIKEAVQQMMASGKDPSAIAKTMQEKVGPLLEAGKISEAEPEIDRILERLASGEKNSGTTSSTETVQQRVMAKIERIKDGVRKIAEGGGDPTPIRTAMEEKVALLLDSGKLPEAEPELDRVLEMLKQDGQSPASPSTQTAGTPPAPAADTVHLRIASKLERLKESSGPAAADGAQPAILKTTQEKLGPLIEAGKFAEAEAELDRVLAQLKPEAR